MKKRGSRAALEAHADDPTVKREAAKADALERIQRLTPRQRDVLDALWAGLSDKEASVLLNIKSTRTVNAHVAAILQRLGVKSRVLATLLWERACK